MGTSHRRLQVLCRLNRWERWKWRGKSTETFFLIYHCIYRLKTFILKCSENQIWENQLKCFSSSYHCIVDLPNPLWKEILSKKSQLKTRFLKNISSDKNIWKWKNFVHVFLFMNWLKTFILKFCLIAWFIDWKHSFWKQEDLETFGKIWAYVAESRSTGHPHTEKSDHQQLSKNKKKLNYSFLI